MNAPPPEQLAQNPATAGDRSAQSVPVPMGTRDILPEEMAELRALSSSLLEAFTAAGYGEVATPAFEFEDAMQLGDKRASNAEYRVPDESGQMLVARFDSTIPIARLAATKCRDTDPPLRFCYLQHVYRAVKPKRGESREFLQAGMELLGLDAPAGDVEGITLLCKVLEAVGLTDFKITIGESGLFDRLLERAGLSGDAHAATRAAILHELQARDLVGLEREVAAVDSVTDELKQQLIETASSRGGAEILDRADCSQLSELHSQLDAAGVSDRIIYDLGLARAPGYYTGTILEIYDPSIGFPLGGGGRYDDLVGRFGRDMAAFGFALNMERLHIAASSQRPAS